MSLHRRNPRHDGNHAEIVGVLRAHGASVVALNAAGVPDLLIGFVRADGTRVNVWVEIKRPAGPRGGTSGRNLTPRQREFRASWRGDLPWVVRTPHEALAVLQYDPSGDDPNPP